jgi:hypothetical protein
VKKHSYREGTAVAVPLSHGGWGIYVVARASAGSIFAYGFGPVRRELPTAEVLTSLLPEETVLIEDTGDIAILDGVWPIIGEVPNFDRRDWPIPDFTTLQRGDAIGRRHHFEDGDPLRESFWLIPVEEVNALPPGGSSGPDRAAVDLSDVIEPWLEAPPISPAGRAQVLDWAAVIRAAQQAAPSGEPSASAQAGEPEEAVIIHMSTISQELVDELELRLGAAMSAVGAFDGLERGSDEVVFYMYGPDADVMLDRTKKALKGLVLPPRSHAIRRRIRNGVETEDVAELS